MIRPCGDSATLRDYFVQELNGAEQPGRGRARTLQYAGEQKALRYPAGLTPLAARAVPDRAPHRRYRHARSCCRFHMRRSGSDWLPPQSSVLRPGRPPDLALRSRTPLDPRPS